MGIFSLFTFFTSARDYAKLDQYSTGLARKLLPEEYLYHRTIIICGKVGGLVGLLGGGATSVTTFLHPSDGSLGYRDIKMIVLVPFIMTAAGILGGACWATVFAPKAFLLGPIGARWLRVVGAKEPASARFVTLVFALLVSALFIFLATLAATGNFN